MNSPTKPAKGIPGGIWALGFVSLLMDVSSELIRSLMPVFMFTALGMSVFTIVLIEGAAQATALIVKIFSGAFSDYWGKRKPLAVLGYGLTAASKPLFALATGAGMVVAARLTDRVGKGIRGAPRDALVADFAPPELRGAAFGLRQSLDIVGAFLGPLLAMGLMLLWANDFRTLRRTASIPTRSTTSTSACSRRPSGRPARCRNSSNWRSGSRPAGIGGTAVGLPFLGAIERRRVRQALSPDARARLDALACARGSVHAPSRSSAAGLLSLSRLVAMDLETTGPNMTQDRIISRSAALPWRKLRAVQHGDAFEIVVRQESESGVENI